MSLLTLPRELLPALLQTPVCVLTMRLVCRHLHESILPPRELFSKICDGVWASDFWIFYTYIGAITSYACIQRRDVLKSSHIDANKLVSYQTSTECGSDDVTKLPKYVWYTRNTVVRVYHDWGLREIEEDKNIFLWTFQLHKGTKKFAEICQENTINYRGEPRDAIMMFKKPSTVDYTLNSIICPRDSARSYNGCEWDGNVYVRKDVFC